MCPLARSGRLYLFTALVALTALGCSQNLENNEQYQAQVSRLERMDEDLKNAQKTISRMETEFQQAAKEIVALKTAVGSGRVAGAPGAATPSDAALKAMEQRLAQLEGQARKSATSPAAPAAASRTQGAPATEEIIDPEAKAPASSGTGKNVTPIVRSGGVPAAKPVRGQMVVSKPTVTKGAGTKAAGAAKKKAARASTPASKSDSVSASSGSVGGTYYKVGPDDTIASIAAKHNLSANSVLAANRLPSNVRLYIGQPLFIPKKGGIYN